MTRALAAAAMLALAACSGPSDDPGAGVPDTGGAADGAAPRPDAAAHAADAAPPPFSCAKAAATSPVLAATFLFEPADPHPGDTLTVLVKSTNGHTQSSAPDMTLDATTAKGTSTIATMITAGTLGTKGVVYHYEVPNVPLGDVCLLTRITGAPEAAAKITVTPRPPPPQGSGVYKVKTNHQLSCQEQVPWGNELHVQVLDANGVGVKGAVVDVVLPATTDLGTVKNADTKPLPKSYTMDGSGKLDDYFWWPGNGNGFTVFQLRVHGAPSDLATEITSGWWETDSAGCRYCDPSQPINVWGHWSHRIVFQLDSTATVQCVVPSDHGGQTACSKHGHLYHDPAYQACWPAQ